MNSSHRAFQVRASTARREGDLPHQNAASAHTCGSVAARHGASAAPESAPGGALDLQIADWLQSLLPDGRPRRLARMYSPGAGDKYRDVAKSESLSPAKLFNHARGLETWAATLDLDGLTRIGAGDVDEATPEAGRAALLARYSDIRRAGLQAIAVHINNPLGEHYGGHIFGFYTDFCDAGDVAAHWRGLLPDVKEIWPCNQVIRLPFGKHKWADSRGELWYLDDAGELHTWQLDIADQRAAALAAVQALPLNGAPPKAVSNPDRTQIENAGSAKPQPYVKTHSPRLAGRQNAAEVIARFNRANPDYIRNDLGAADRSGNRLCTCPGHSSGKPNIIVWKDADGIDRAQSYSPDCTIYPPHKGKRYIDPFELYAIREHGGDRVAALKALNPIAPRQHQRREPPPLVEPPAQRVQTAEQIAEAERKRAARRAAAAATLASVQARASQDAELSDSAQLVLLALLDVAGDRAWCRPSIARLAEMTTLCRRAVYYGLEELAEREYIASSQAPGRTTVRTFLRVHSAIADCTPRAPGSIASTDPTPTRGACEGGGAPDSLDTWCWAADSHGAAELSAALVEPEPAAEPRAAVVEPPRILSVGSPDARGLQRVRWSDGAVTWRRAAADHTSAQPAGPGASYTPALDWTNGGRLELPHAPAAAPSEIIQLDPLEQAPPATSDPRYVEFIWRWRASQPGAICKRTGRPWSAAQRARFRLEIQQQHLLDDVSPDEAALRWAALDQPQPRKGRQPRATGRPLTSSRAAGPPVDQQLPLFSLPEVLAELRAQRRTGWGVCPPHLTPRPPLDSIDVPQLAFFVGGQ